MADEPTTELAEIVVGCEWFTQPEPMFDCSLIMFNHPKHGKLWFGIPFHEAAQLAGFLTRQVEEKLESLRAELVTASKTENANG